MNHHFKHEEDQTDGDLVIIPGGSAYALFTTEDGLAPLIDKVRAAVAAFEPDVSTLRGRKAILAMTTKVVKAKTYLEKAGAELAAEQKKIPGKIDKARRELKEALDALRDEVRQPLTDWETKEDARVEAHKTRIGYLETYANPGAAASLEALAEFRANAEKIEAGANCEEFEAETARVKAETLATLDALIAARQQYEAEQAELAELRRLKAERDEADWIAAEAKAAEERAAAAKKAEEDRQAAAVAKALADAEAAREAEVLRAARAAADERQRAEYAVAVEREAAAAREAQLRATVEAAERKAQETEARIKREAEAAQAKAAAEQAAREADRDHRASVNREVRDDLLAAGFSAADALTIITAICKGEIRHVSLKY